MVALLVEMEEDFSACKAVTSTIHKSDRWVAHKLDEMAVQKDHKSDGLVAHKLSEKVIQCHMPCACAGGVQAPCACAGGVQAAT